MHLSRLKVVCVVALIAVCSLPALAQSDSAEISGRITDPTGAVISGAQVQLKDVARGTTTTVTTNRVGLYAFPDVRPGTYSMTIDATGFSHLDLIKITANTQDHLEQNFKLNVGSASETMTINSDDRVDLGTSISTSVDNRFVENMPLNGQSIQQLVAITPGVQRTAGAGQFSFNGVRDNSNYITVDGVSANTGTISNPNPAGLGQYGAGQAGGYTAVGTSSSLGSLDDIQEIKVQASSYSAEFGRSAGGQIQITSQSGANLPHGNVFEYLRNEDLDAIDSFTKYSGVLTRVTTPTFVTLKPKDRQNDFGGAFGAPIFIPHVYNGRNKSFFFVSVEALKLLQPVSRNSTVPAACFRTNSCSTVVPAALLPYLLIPPPPDILIGTSPGYAGTYTDPASSTASSVRLDHQLFPKLQIFARASYTPSQSAVRLLNQVDTQRYNIKSFTFGANEQVTNSITNEFRANYTRNTGQNVYTLDNYAGGSTPSSDMLALMFPAQYGALPANAQFNLSAIGGGTLGSASYNIGTSNANTQRQVNLVDNITYQIKGHTLKVGFDFRRLFPVAAPKLYEQSVLFSGATTLASGMPSYQNVYSNDKVVVHINNISFYAQDSWRVTPKLTLDYGVRFDINPPPYGDSGAGALYVASSTSNFMNVTLAPAGTPLYPTKYGTFQPRVGASYEFNDRHYYEGILRGGFGLYYDTNDDTAVNAAVYFPHARNTSVYNLSFPGTPIPPPTPPAGPPYTGQNILGFDPTFTLPLYYEWNVALQQGIGQNQAIQFSYVGSAGTNLTRYSAYSAYSGFNRFLNFTIYGSPDISNYQSAQVAYQRRLYKNLQVLANYVWSKSLDSTSDDGTLTALSSLDTSREYGLSAFDVRNNFNASISYDFPKFSTVYAPARYVLKDWSTDIIFQDHDGNPLTVTFTQLINGASSAQYRPNLVPGVPLFLTTAASGSIGPFGGERLNPAAFSTAFVSTGSTTQGNEPRGYVPGRPIQELDTTLRREFMLRDSFHLQFRVDAFNVLNKTTYASYDLNYGTYSAGTLIANSTFGTILGSFNNPAVAGTSNLGGGFYGVGRNRSLQVALKIKF